MLPDAFFVACDFDGSSWRIGLGVVTVLADVNFLPGGKIRVSR